jgi:hypothetical protein
MNVVCCAYSQIPHQHQTQQYHSYWCVSQHLVAEEEGRHPRGRVLVEQAPSLSVRSQDAGEVRQHPISPIASSEQDLVN